MSVSPEMGMAPSPAPSASPSPVSLMWYSRCGAWCMAGPRYCRMRASTSISHPCHWLNHRPNLSSGGLVPFPAGLRGHFIWHANLAVRAGGSLLRHVFFGTVITTRSVMCQTADYSVISLPTYKDRRLATIASRMMACRLLPN